MKNTRIKPTKWLNKWKIMMSNIKKYDLSKFKKSVWLYNLETWIKFYSSKLTLFLKQKISDFFQNDFSTYSIVLKKIREHFKNATRERTIKKNVFVAMTTDFENDDVKKTAVQTFKRQRANTLGKARKKNDAFSKNSCFVCNRKKHSIVKCWYILPKLISDWWKLSDVMKKFVEDRIDENAKLKRKVMNIKKQKKKNRKKKRKKEKKSEKRLKRQKWRWRCWCIAITTIETWSEWSKWFIIE